MEPFNEESEQFQDKTLQLLVPNSKRLGGYTQMEVLFSKKVHTTRRSHEALHGFAQESTRTTLVPTQRDLKEQDEASRTQPRSARGLVSTGPIGYPARKEEDLDQLGFFSCNLSSSITLIVNRLGFWPPNYIKEGRTPWIGSSTEQLYDTTLHNQSNAKANTDWT